MTASTELVDEYKGAYRAEMRSHRRTENLRRAQLAKLNEALEALQLAHVFLDSLPHGWLAKTSGDVGALNDFYIKSAKALRNKLEA